MAICSNKKTILSLVDLTFDKLGSFEMFLLLLSEKLKESNYESVLVFNKDVSERLKSKCDGIIVDHLPRNNRIQFYYQLLKIMFKHKPDIVHIGFYPLMSPMTLIIYFFGCHNIIMTDHFSGDVTQHKGVKKGYIFLRNKLYSRFIKKITCVSDYVLERDKSIIGMDPTKLMRSYPGVCLERFRPSANATIFRQELNIPKDAFVISSVAHLIKEKGIDYLLKAAKIIVDNHNDVYFLIVGTGKEENELKALTSELGIVEKVRFLGSRDDSEKILSISEVFVCPSLWLEAFGLTNIEAMACGIPVIASKVGGIPEIIEDNITGILVNTKDSQALADAMERLYSDPELRKSMGQRSLERATEHFDLDRAVNEIISIYKNRA